jgi:DNA-3-methyladenine glycosylase I
MASREESKKRCAWAVGDPLLIEYHDHEWGRPLEQDEELFERLALEVFQAGLSWRLILHKRVALKKAFADFSIDKVAAFSEQDVAHLLENRDIIRNKLKIHATIENARRLQKIIAEHGSFANYLSQLRGDREYLFRELKQRFQFMGPKIAECFLQSIGKLDGAHDPGCSLAGETRRHK